VSNTKLYNKYRFKSLDETIGDLAHLNKLKKDIESGNIDHTYLFYGIHGLGKTSMARVMGSNIPDCYIEEISSAVDNGVAKSKEIANNIHQIPLGYKNKLIILDEIQKASSAFFDALLKATEEPPENVFFILCTTEFKKIPANIKSRFTKIEFKAPDMKSMRDHLVYICKEESLTVERKVLTEICKINNSIPRDCISSLQLLVGIDDSETQLKLISSLEEAEKGIGYELSKALYSSSTKWSTITKLLQNVSASEVEGIRRVVLNYHAKVLLNTGDKNSALILDSFKTEMYDTPLPSLLLAIYENI
jgi:DNA polymerase-3 subunit gamma/tau